MRPIRTILNMLFCCALLSACADPPPKPLSARGNEGVLPTQQVSVREARHMVIGAGTEEGLDPAQRLSLQHFIGGFAEHSPQSLHITLRGYPDPALLDGVRGELIAAGIDPVKIEILPIAADAAIQSRNQIEILAQKYTAIPLPCPDNTHIIAGDGENRVSSEFGCADKGNISAMIADPRDLIRGETGGTTDAILTSAAIDRLHQDKTKPVEKQSVGQ